MYYKVKITEEYRQTPRHTAYNSNRVVETFPTKLKAKEWLEEKYNQAPLRSRTPIFQEPDGERTGFIKSYWTDAYDREHPGKKIFQTDWVTVTEVTEKPTLLL